MKSKITELILLMLVPLSEIKALFYNSNIKVSWYIFSNNKKFLCNVLEDYSNIIIISTIFYYYLFITMTRRLKIIVFFLFTLSILDFIHLGLMDMQYFIATKIFISLIITATYAKYKTTYYKCS